MDKVLFPYRSSTHLPLLHVIAESGAWEKHGLEVEYNKRITSGDAHARVMSGDVDFVGGNHVSPYGHRARGDQWVYLGQTVNVVPGRKLVVRADAGIEKIEDLREKVVGSRGAHPMLNDWLQLKKHGLDTDRDEVAVVDQFTNTKMTDGIHMVAETAEDRTAPLWKWVLDKRVDAAFLQVPQCLFAEEANLKVIDIEPLPMIYFTTISTSLRFAERHPDLIERFLKAMIEGIHFFKTERERSIGIIKERYLNDGQMDDAMAKITHEVLADALAPHLFPTLDAIENVYEEGIREDDDARRINPLELWDVHYLRKIADSGFVDALYGKGREAAVSTKH
jgi:ABC-type nitrate/sulfonate/bicarbonate transport system substrate-binding protein